MTVWIKQGVLGRLSPPMRRCKGRLVDFYEARGLDFFITSKGEGNHCSSSCHYEDNAIDFKRQRVAKEDIEVICEKLYKNCFDVVEYSDIRDIFHVEYDPK